MIPELTKAQLRIMGILKDNTGYALVHKFYWKLKCSGDFYKYFKGTTNIKTVGVLERRGLFNKVGDGWVLSKEGLGVLLLKEQTK